MKKIKGDFARTSPAAFAEKIGIPQGWFVISHNWVPTKKARRLSHGKWFKISSSEGSVYRILRFSVKLRGTPKSGTGDIVLDWPGLLKLSGYAEDIPEEITLEITKIKWWEYAFVPFSHPDPTIKLASILAALSVGLGLVSVAISVCG